MRRAVGGGAQASSVTKEAPAGAAAESAAAATIVRVSEWFGRTLVWTCAPSNSVDPSVRHELCARSMLIELITSRRLRMSGIVST